MEDGSGDDDPRPFSPGETAALVTMCIFGAAANARSVHHLRQEGRGEDMLRILDL